MGRGLRSSGMTTPQPRQATSVSVSRTLSPPGHTSVAPRLFVRVSTRGWGPLAAFLGRVLALLNALRQRSEKKRRPLRPVSSRSQLQAQLRAIAPKALVCPLGLRE